MSAEKWASFWLCIVVASLFALGVLLSSVKISFARDLGQWSNVDPEISAWYRSLKQPGSEVSCCGPADSYTCDEGADGNQVYCIIDDDRDDAVLMRTHVANGTKILIPPERLNKDPNILGRAIVFLGGGSFVWCFISGGAS